MFGVRLSEDDQPSRSHWLIWPTAKAQAIAFTGKWLLAGIFIEDPLQRCTFKRTSIGHSLRFSSEGGWRSRADEPIEFETLEAPGRS